MRPGKRPKDHIPKGGFIIARKIFESNIWIKDPLYLKVWIWIIGRANHSDNYKNGRHYKRGEFVTSYNEIIKATSYYHNRSHITPSLKKIRIILKWLQNEGMILVKPLKSGLGLTGADPTARTRAYVGIRIIVINYRAYQAFDNYKGRDKGRPFVQQGHNNKNDNKNDNTLDIFSLKKRYAHPELIDQAFQAIASTRKFGRVADSVLIAQLQKWERYPVEQVEAGIRIYLDKDCAEEGKDEKYLMGIIRKNNGWQKAAKCRTPEWL
jgi:hypothetical protein